MNRSLVTAAVVVVGTLLVPGPAWAQSATPVPAPTPPYDCGARLEVPASPVDAWGMDGRGGAEVTVHGSPRDPGSRVTLYGYTRPTGEPPQARELASALTDAQSVARIRLPVQGSTRLYAVAEHCVFSSESQVIVVRDRLGMTAQRLSPRRYRFSGFHGGPAGKALSLYRVTAEGRSVLSAQTRTGGEWWQVDRTFLGSGEWEFYIATGTDQNSTGTTSGRRRTVIH